MANRAWHLALQGTVYKVELKTTLVPRSLVISVNGRAAIRDSSADARGPYAFKIGPHHGQVVVTEDAGVRHFELTADGGPAVPDGLSAAEDMAEWPALARMRQRGARWFRWIAQLSAFNTLLSASGSTVSFLGTGLGSTYVIDKTASSLLATMQPPPIATLLDFGLAGMFYAFGRIGRTGAAWPFTAGMSIYAADAIASALYTDWLAFLLHLVGLYYIYRGWQAARVLEGTPAAALIA